VRRFTILVFVFVLGAALAYGVIRVYDRVSGRDDRRAAQNLATLLEQQPSSSTVVDTPMVLAAERIQRSVVNIDTLEPGQRRGYVWGMPVYQTMQGKGSGVIISADGHIFTNNHVVANATIIRVTLPSGEHYDGRLIASDADADLALVKIDGANLVPAVIGDSDRLKVGEYVLAVGNPLGVGTTVTHGIISAIHKGDLQVDEGHVLHKPLQTDAPINPGNSGGALANMRGQLIGINTAIASPSGGSVGLGFAIPANSARMVLRDLLSRTPNRTATREEPFMGIVFGPVPPDVASQLNLAPGQGVFVAQVTPLTGAADAGVVPGSIIVAADGRPITNPSDLTTTVRRHTIGETITLRLIGTDGTRRETKVHLGRRPPGT
jgi:S1-C subfamily serine protease